MSAGSLAERIQRLEDIEAIRDLMARYATYVNKGWAGKTVNADLMPTIFADDAKYDSPDMGVSGQGVDRIMEGLIKDTAIIEFSMHTFLNPVVEVNGDAATGNWLMWIAVRREGGARMVFLSHDITYQRTPAGWRIKTLLLHIGAMMPFPSN